MTIRRRFNFEAKKVEIYCADIVAGVTFYNLKTVRGGCSAMVAAVVGDAESLERVGHYGFTCSKRLGDVEVQAMNQKILEVTCDRYEEKRRRRQSSQPL